jgi:hypothetical protein
MALIRLIKYDFLIVFFITNHIIQQNKLSIINHT